MDRVPTSTQAIGIGVCCCSDFVGCVTVVRGFLQGFAFSCRVITKPSPSNKAKFVINKLNSPITCSLYISSSLVRRARPISAILRAQPPQCAAVSSGHQMTAHFGTSVALAPQMRYPRFCAGTVAKTSSIIGLPAAAPLGHAAWHFLGTAAPHSAPRATVATPHVSPTPACRHLILTYPDYPRVLSGP